MVDGNVDRPAADDAGGCVPPGRKLPPSKGRAGWSRFRGRSAGHAQFRIRFTNPFARSRSFAGDAASIAAITIEPAETIEVARPENSSLSIDHPGPRQRLPDRGRRSGRQVR